jgi:XTP/dITP diphosphohydrolase
MKGSTNPSQEANLQAFERILNILQTLRAQCPWDQEQTMESLRHLVIEETFELSEAVLTNNMQEIKKELGDLFFHILFYTHLATEKQAFTTANMIHAVCDKLIHRHPHIYGDIQASDVETVQKNWAQIKLQEDSNHTVLQGVPPSLPTLIKAMRIQEKASMAGFDWQAAEQVWLKVQEEANELQQALQEPDTNENKQEHIQEELGDLLFSLVNYARFIKVNPDTALEKANQKFIKRFQHVEQQAKDEGKQLNQLSVEQIIYYWEQAKTHNLH